MNAHYLRVCEPSKLERAMFQARSGSDTLRPCSGADLGPCGPGLWGLKGTSMYPDGDYDHSYFGIYSTWWYYQISGNTQIGPVRHDQKSGNASIMVLPDFWSYDQFR